MSSIDLPYWQLHSIFSGLNSDDYLAAKTRLKTQIQTLEQFMNKHQIGSGKRLEPSLDLHRLIDELTEHINQIGELSQDLRSYLTGFISTDAFNDEAKAEASHLLDLQTRYATLMKRFSAFLGRLELEPYFETSDFAKSQHYALKRAQALAHHLMTDSEEALASQLDASGGGAWARLHSELISRSSIKATLAGQNQSEFAVTELKNLQSDANSTLRKAAYETELELLSQHEVSFAAAINSIKGQVNELSQKRGWESALQEALFQNALSEKALDAMQEACRESFDYFRRYLKAKASFLGKDTLAWYDLNAPVSVSKSQSYSYAEAQQFIITSFETYSDDLAQYAKKAFEANWLDVPPRKGKRNGAFCMAVPGRKESRIMLNYGHTLDDIFTLAHELGHGYHNEQMYQFGRSSLNRNTPMTLAETASIFCETIVVNQLLNTASEEEKLSILEQDLLGATQLILDIHSRFIFEKTVFEKRKERELSITELKAIMLDAQAQTYGNGLTANERHPLMWAFKGHYYSTSRSFYNFPYTFGYLFGLGIYAEYQRKPEGFQTRYNKLLASTGMADAKTLAESFGIDIEDKAFWKASLSIAEARVIDYERLVETFKP